MNYQERVDYLVGKGWVHNPEAPHGKRWFSPYTGERHSMEGSTKIQRSIEAGKLFVAVCGDCKKKEMSAVADKPHQCRHCKSLSRMKAMGCLMDEAKGSSIILTKTMTEALSDLAKKNKLPLKRMAHVVLSKGMEVME